MGWSTTDWTPGNIQAYADEFWLAVNERKALLGQTPYLVPVAGANIQSASTTPPASTTGIFSWRVLQNWIASDNDNFICSHDDDGTKRAKDYFDKEALRPLWNFYDLMTAVRGGTSQTDFRRATTWPSDWTDWDDPAYSTGKIQEGDIIGPWIFSDLRAAINMLIWAEWGAQWNSTMKSGGKYAPDLGDAKSGAAAAYAASSSPSELKAGAVSQVAGSEGVGEKYAYLARVYGVPYKDTILPLPFNVRCDLCIYAEAAYGGTGDFDNNGDDLLEDKWNVMDTRNVSVNQSSVTFDAVGSSTAPNWGGEGYRGYSINSASQHIVCYADIEDGFEYV